MNRAFECPKCSGCTADIKYSYVKDILNLKCRQCEYRWNEKPSDVKEKEAEHAGV